MAENFNIQTTQQQANEAEGLNDNNPAMTYVDFANQIARNSQQQQYQQALIDQAKLKLKQSQSAADLGVNPELKDFLSVQEAVGELKAAGVSDDDIKAFTDSIGDQKEVSRQSVDTVIRKKQLAQRAGQPFVATDEDVKAGKVDEAGKPLISGQSYQAFVDPNTGETQYIRAGGEGIAAKEAGVDLKESEADEKQWQKLDAEINKYTRTSRGNSLVQAVQRATRALNEMTNGQPLTPQVLGFVHDDIAGIFQGGVPPVTGKDATSFLTAKDEINKVISKYTGKFSFFQGDIGNQRQYLTQLISRLLVSSENMLVSDIQSEQAGYKKIIQKDPARWQQMLQDKTGTVMAGLSAGAGPAITEAKQELSAPAGAAAPTGGTAPAPGGAPAANDPLGIR